MKLAVEIELGNDGMQTRYDAFEALRRSFVVGAENALARLGPGDFGAILDLNGNTVGQWVAYDPEMIGCAKHGDRFVWTCEACRVVNEP